MGFFPEYYACIEAQDSAYYLIEKIEKVLTGHSGYVRAEEGSLEYVPKRFLIYRRNVPPLRISIQQGEERVWAHFFFYVPRKEKIEISVWFILATLLFLFASVQMLQSSGWMALPPILIFTGFMTAAYILFAAVTKFECNNVMRDLSYYLNIPYPKAVRLNKFRYWLQRKWNRRKTEKGSQ